MLVAIELRRKLVSVVFSRMIQKRSHTDVEAEEDPTAASSNPRPFKLARQFHQRRPFDDTVTSGM